MIDVDVSYEPPEQPEAGRPALIAYVKADPPQSGSHFGHVLAVDDKSLLVAATSANVGGAEQAGRVYMLDQADLNRAPDEIALPDPSPQDGVLDPTFLPGPIQLEGWSGLQVDLDANLVAIGVAAKDVAETSAPEVGAVYAYAREDLQAPPQRLSTPGLETGDLFGFGVALSGDWIAVGCPGDDDGIEDGNGRDNTAQDSGAVYLFQRSGQRFVFQQRIKAPNIRADDFFGASVALNADLLAIGAPRYSGRGGTTHLYRLRSTKWSHQDDLEPLNQGSVLGFGAAVSLSGNTVAVGASLTEGCDDAMVRSGLGAVYVFEEADEKWAQEACLSPVDAPAGSLWGWSVALDGDRLLAGAPFQPVPVSSKVGGEPSEVSVIVAGGVYFYERNASGQWGRARSLTAPVPNLGDAFGAAVGLGSGVLVVGTPRESGGQSGPDADLSDEGAFESGAVFVFDSLAL